jgi:hypothetical protein
MAQPTVRRVRSVEDRNAGRGQFITLKQTNDQFVGFALFKPDPELDDNPGYFEYFEHYTPATGYFPCIGDDCPLCAEGDNPSTRAKTLWLVPNDNKEMDADDAIVKVFTMNWSVIQEFADLHADDETILSRAFRIKRLEGNGKYAVRPKPEKLKAPQVKAALKDAPDLEQLATKQAARVMEDLDTAEAMEADEDKAEEKATAKQSSTSKAKKGKPAEEPEPETGEDFDPEEAKEFAGEVTVKKLNKSKLILTVETGDVSFDVYLIEGGDFDIEDYNKDDTLYIEAAKDEDGDFIASVVTNAEEPAEEPEPGDEGDEPELFEGDDFDGKVTVVSVNSENDTLTVKTEDDKTFELYFLGEGEDEDGNDWSNLDLDDFSEDEEIVVVAERDGEGDMLASKFPAKAKGKKAAAGAKKASGRK